MHIKLAVASLMCNFKKLEPSAEQLEPISILDFSAKKSRFVSGCQLFGNFCKFNHHHTMIRLIQLHDEEGWRQVFQQAGAFWLYQGDPCAERSHAELTSGKCSNGFFNGTKVTEDVRLLASSCQDLYLRLKTAGLDPRQVHRVVGPAVGAITFAHNLALAMFCQKSGYTEKDGENQILRRFEVTGENIVACDDTITTCGSVQKTIAAGRAGGAKMLPFIPVICNRSGLHEVEGFRIVSLISPNIGAWDPNQCPYCAVGSKRLRPKAHWAELTAA